MTAMTATTSEATAPGTRAERSRCSRERVPRSRGRARLLFHDGDVVIAFRLLSGSRRRPGLLNLSVGLFEVALHGETLLSLALMRVHLPQERIVDVHSTIVDIGRVPAVGKRKCRSGVLQWPSRGIGQREADRELHPNAPVASRGVRRFYGGSRPGRGSADQSRPARARCPRALRSYPVGRARGTRGSRKLIRPERLHFSVHNGIVSHVRPEGPADNYREESDENRCGACSRRRGCHPQAIQVWQGFTKDDED